MNEIESKIAQRLNNAIDKIKPNNLESILSEADNTSIKITSKRKTPFLQIGIGFAAVCIITAMSWLIISPKVINKGSNPNNLYATGLSHYQSHISMPNCSLYFNEGEAESKSAGLFIHKEVGIYSEKDIIKQFGFDPLKNLWVPSDLKSCFRTSTKWTPFDDVVCYVAQGGWWLVSSYKSDPENYDCKTVTIAMSPLLPPSSDVEPTGEIKFSNIYGTDVIITHQPQGKKDSLNVIYPTEMFSAKFTYRDVGYSIYTSHGVSQIEFVKILTSILKP